MYSKLDSIGSARARYYRRSIARTIKVDKWYFFFSLCYFSGVFLGAEGVRWIAQPVRESISYLCTGFLEARTAQTLQQTALSSFGSAFWLVALLFLLGFCAISMPLIPMAVLFKGLGYGATMSALLQSGEFSTMAVCLLIIPFAVASGAVLICAARYSMELSLCCFSVFRGERPAKEPEIGQYCRTFLGLTLLTALAAVADAFWYSGAAANLLL